MNNDQPLFDRFIAICELVEALEKDPGPYKGCAAQIASELIDEAIGIELLANAAKALRNALKDTVSMLEIYTNPSRRMEGFPRGEALSAIRDAKAALAAAEGRAE